MASCPLRTGIVLHFVTNTTQYNRRVLAAQNVLTICVMNALRQYEISTPDRSRTTIIRTRGDELVAKILASIALQEPHPKATRSTPLTS